MRRRRLAALTLVGHLVLAALVARDARLRGDDAGAWTLTTLCTGVVGAAGYLARRR